ncbi:hypothetical protein F5B22DRAFT_590213 [Xylaria bambusicola]|uniref:uncharacterized protein n=1 Tax=Xylaria bambusicola TaxID=326684 RepID=UPI002007D8B8|nr:uncharacterized protein F5B22DRAFT_590213 [Xylaria bambusicola]KAI0525501.1 hypothetical protein F5B22DRAFT_590213 [Xylaria bambusicola]
MPLLFSLYLYLCLCLCLLFLFSSFDPCSICWPPFRHNSIPYRIAACQDTYLPMHTVGDLATSSNRHVHQLPTYIRPTPDLHQDLLRTSTPPASAYRPL